MKGSDCGDTDSCRYFPVNAHAYAYVHRSRSFFHIILLCKTESMLFN